MGTADGVLLGTAAYMSPEQARGKPVDRRADIWTFGVVLFEMLTGRHPFQGETHSDTLAAVLRQDPDFDLLPDGLSPRVRGLLRRCLERDPGRRLQSIGEARIALEDESEGIPDPAERRIAEASDADPPRPRSWLPWTVAAAAVIAAILLGTLRPGRPAEPGRVVSQLLPPRGWTYNTTEGPPVFSPDGCELAFLANDSSGRSHLFLRALDDPEPRLLEGTENAQAPFWAPDGRRLAFFADDKLKKIDLREGSPEVLCDARLPHGGTWSEDGTILFAARFPAGFRMVDERGGAARPLPLPGGEAWHVLWPQFLPDGRHFLFTVADLEGSNGGIHVGSLDDSESSELLLPAISRAIYAEPGWLLFWQEGNVRAVEFDAATRRLGQEIRGLAQGVGIAQYLVYGRFDAFGEELLVYQPGSGRVGDTELVLLDRGGHRLSVVGPRAEYYAPRLSHDGQHVAVDITEFRGPDSPYGDIWTVDLRRGTRTRLTRSNINASEPIWTPDDANVIYRLNPDLYIRDASGVSEQRLVLESDELKGAHDVSPDGRYLLFSRHVNEGDLWILDLETGEDTAWIATDYAEMGGRFSPDGNWVAYQSDESGLVEVYLQSFPETRERIVVSAGGGRSPAWRADGGELYYLSAAGEITAVPVAWESGRPLPGEPQALFRVRTRMYRTHGQFDVSPDGQSFLVNRLVIEGGDEPLVLVQNWAAGRP